MRNNYLKSLQFIFVAIGLGQLVLGIVFLSIQQDTYFSFKEGLNPMHIIVPVAAFSALLAVQVFFKQIKKRFL